MPFPINPSQSVEAGINNQRNLQNRRSQSEAFQTPITKVMGDKPFAGFGRRGFAMPQFQNGGGIPKFGLQGVSFSPGGVYSPQQQHQRYLQQQQAFSQAGQGGGRGLIPVQPSLPFGLRPITPTTNITNIG